MLEQQVMEAQKLVGAVPVPNVQELSKQRMIKIPPRYTRTDLPDPPFTSYCDVAEQLPGIDLSRLASVDTKDEEIEKLDLACKQWGFFQLINHGVSSSLLDDVKKIAKEFFELPIEEKNKYRQLPGEVQGFGQMFVVSDDQKLDWGDMIYFAPYPKHIRSRLFETFPQEYRETIEAYCEVMRHLATNLLSFIADALNMDRNYMMNLFEEGKQDFRINYYPPCPQPDLVMGLTPHSDASAVTFLLQVNDIAGLQVKKDGKWILVNPLPNAFIVNIGDLLQVVTNGTYRSIEHRAIVNLTKERLSIALFHTMRLDGVVCPAPCLLTPESPAIYRTVSFADFSNGSFSQKLNGKSYIDQLKL